ncbi:phosphoglyceromutase [Pavlovales sp. CCMP2436]|nr:phosphoglyceromutase [Pavlovales sp. CCMP2436]
MGGAVAARGMGRALVLLTLHAAPSHARLTLVRHGQSEWNLANRFTGWVDVDLTERGITEARAAGRMLLEAGLEHDLICTSTLRRAIRTASLLLSSTRECWLPIVKDARLNEQHSGALTGLNKRELAEEFGVDKVMVWRRSYNSPPPQIALDHPLQSAVPSAESLADTLVRVTSFYEDTLRPALAAGKRVLVVSHGNTLRALVKLIEGIANEETYNLDLPTACPVVYELDEMLRPVHVGELAHTAPR